MGKLVVFCHRVRLVYLSSYFLLSRSSTMAFGDLKTEKGVEALNTFLADKSYIEGYAPSQADVTTINAMNKAPASSMAHALRWYNHIKSFGAESSSFPGAKAPAAAAAPLQLLPMMMMMMLIFSDLMMKKMLPLPPNSRKQANLSSLPSPPSSSMSNHGMMKPT